MSAYKTFFRQHAVRRRGARKGQCPRLYSPSMHALRRLRRVSSTRICSQATGRWFWLVEGTNTAMSAGWEEAAVLDKTLNHTSMRFGGFSQVAPGHIVRWAADCTMVCRSWKWWRLESYKNNVCEIDFIKLFEIDFKKPIAKKNKRSVNKYVLAKKKMAVGLSIAVSLYRTMRYARARECILIHVVTRSWFLVD